MKNNIFRKWPVHNLVGHPLGEIAYWIVRPFGKDKAVYIFDLIHDGTFPKESNRYE